MFHPLANDLSKLTDAELQTKHGELTKRITQAYRYGNTGIVEQLNMLLADYQFELQRRNQKMLEDLAKNNPKFDGTIDIS